jgi:pantetheine-phosphate adenylyltransferase
MASVLYPGSFDPVTKGHVDVILRLKKIFNQVVVLVADSPRKNYLFTRDERVALIQKAMGRTSGVRVVSSDDLTVNYAIKNKIKVIARSVRTVADWEYEYALADGNKKLAPNIETLFIMADPQHGFISSSLVREIAAYDGNTKPFVPANVAVELKKKTRGKK